MKQKSKVCKTGKRAKTPCISTVFPFGALAPGRTLPRPSMAFKRSAVRSRLSPQKTTNRKAESLAVLLYLQVRIHPLPHQYTAFNDDGKLEFPYTLSVPPRGCQLHGRGQSKHDVHIHFRKHSATDSAGSQYNSLLHRLW